MICRYPNPLESWHLLLRYVQSLESCCFDDVDLGMLVVWVISRYLFCLLSYCIELLTRSSLGSLKNVVSVHDGESF
jgi:hypothetical protein